MSNQDIVALFRDLTTGQAEHQRAVGFGQEGDRLRARLLATSPHAEEEREERAADLRNYYIAKLALIDTEVAEAIEELRHGREMGEAWYADPTEKSGRTHVKANADHYAGGCAKPEGVPSELADVVIRCLSLAGEVGIDLGAAIVEKLEYNATRAHRHGGKTI